MTGSYRALFNASGTFKQSDQKSIETNTRYTNHEEPKDEEIVLAEIDGESSQIKIIDDNHSQVNETLGVENKQEEGELDVKDLNSVDK
jgi:hypothetical protein